MPQKRAKKAARAHSKAGYRAALKPGSSRSKVGYVKGKRVKKSAMDKKLSGPYKPKRKKK